MILQIQETQTITQNFRPQTFSSAGRFKNISRKPTRVGTGGGGGGAERGYKIR